VVPQNDVPAAARRPIRYTGAYSSDLAPEQRAEALRIRRIEFASAGAMRKPKEAIAA
jgi:hypothetical protein